MNSLGETAERLIQSHPESAEDLQEKCTELNQAWSSLGKRANQRKEKLGDSHDLQRFLSDFRYISPQRRERVASSENQLQISFLPQSAGLRTFVPFAGTSCLGSMGSGGWSLQMNWQRM